MFNLNYTIMENEKKELVSSVKGLGSWLGIHLEITLFGVTILDWRYPPENKTAPSRP